MIEDLVCAMKEADYFERFAVRVALVREPVGRVERKLDGPQSVFEVFRRLADLDRECVAVALLDGQHRLSAIHAVHVGTASQSPVGVPDVFKAAILANARGIILVHNHPSGNPEPSTDDIALTRRVKQAGELLGVPLLDHVIVGECGYTSLSERREL